MHLTCLISSSAGMRESGLNNLLTLTSQFAMANSNRQFIFFGVVIMFTTRVNLLIVFLLDTISNFQNVIFI